MKRYFPVNEIEREFAYHPKWTTILACAGFFGLAAVVLGIKAANNDRGLIINGIVELGPEGATVFYWVLTAASMGFVAAAVLIAYHRLTYRQRLAFGRSALIVPAWRWSRQEKEIAYQDIRELSTATISGQRFLNITHRGGKFTITASLLPSKAAFEEVRELLAAKIRDLQPESLYVVRLTESGVSCTDHEGATESAAWADLQKVEIVTTDQGPLLPDVFFVLHGSKANCVVPQGATGDRELLERIQQLSGFRNDMVIEAMSSTDNRRFLCWEKLDSTEPGTMVDRPGE
jgi:hypothetical protein